MVPVKRSRETKVRCHRKFWSVEMGEYEREGQVGRVVCEPIDGCSSERETATGGGRVSQALAPTPITTCEHSVIQVRSRSSGGAELLVKSWENAKAGRLPRPNGPI